MYINPAGNFDALVFAEIKPGKWIAGSDSFHRTKNVALSPESTTEEKFCIAATYDNRLKNGRGAIQLYRNGVKHGLPYRKSVTNNYLQKRIYTAGDWGIQIGKYAIEPASKFTQLLQLANPKSSSQRPSCASLQVTETIHLGVSMPPYTTLVCGTEH